MTLGSAKLFDSNNENSKSPSHKDLQKPSPKALKPPPPRTPSKSRSGVVQPKSHESLIPAPVPKPKTVKKKVSAQHKKSSKKVIRSDDDLKVQPLPKFIEKKSNFSPNRKAELARDEVDKSPIFQIDARFSSPFKRFYEENSGKPEFVRAVVMM